MTTMDREMLTELLDLDVDAGLSELEKARLEVGLAAHGDLVSERRRLEALHSLMRESAIPVRPDFRGQVMAQLPSPAWQPSSVPVWALPLAMLLLAGVAGAFVLSFASPSAGPIAGTGLALFDFFQVTALAGAGLIAASWRGLGLGLEELIASSGMSLVALVVFVACLNLLFFSMLRRRSTEILPILEQTATDESQKND